MKNVLMFFLLAAITSCGKMADGTSVWADGLWVIPVVCFIGAAISLYKAIKASGSGAEHLDTRTGEWVQDGEKIKVWETTQFKFFAFFLFLAIVVIVVVNYEK